MDTRLVIYLRVSVPSLISDRTYAEEAINYLLIKTGRKNITIVSGYDETEARSKLNLHIQLLSKLNPDMDIQLGESIKLLKRLVAKYRQHDVVVVSNLLNEQTAADLNLGNKCKSFSVYSPEKDTLTLIKP